MTKFLSILTIFLISLSTFQTARAVPKTNPDISVNVLLLGRQSFKEKEHKENTEHEEEHEEEHEAHEEHNTGHAHNLNDGFSIQEVEFYFKSNIDPYWTGNVSLGISQHENRFDLDLEEAFVESLFIPNLTLRAGKFYAFFGRHNNLHTHHYPFIDPPLINQTLFGSHGWNGSGASLAYLSPLPWYSELIAQAFYSHVKQKKISGILFFKNLWDLNDRSTLELDLSYGTKIKNYEHLYNASLVWKWKNLESAKNHSIAWTTELTQALENTSPENVGGLSSYIQWQFLKNWWLEGRAEYTGRPYFNSIKNQKYSLLLAFTATEYSAIRLQYSGIRKDHEGWEHGVAIQSNMSLGTHPAHLY